MPRSWKPFGGLYLLVALFMLPLGLSVVAMAYNQAVVALLLAAVCPCALVGSWLTLRDEGSGDEAPDDEDEPDAPGRDGLASVASGLAVERTRAGEVSLNVLVGGPDPEAVARASRTLSVRAVGEHRWDPAFTGRVTVLVSMLRTRDTPALERLMDAAMDGARRDLAETGWSTDGGAPIVLAWQRLGPGEAPAAGDEQ